MWTNTWVCQKPEWSTCGPIHVLSRKVNLSDWSQPHKRVCYLKKPSSPTSTVFISYIASVALIRPQITQKMIQNGGNWAERQNKQQIIYLNEYLLDSSEVKGEF